MRVNFRLLSWLSAGIVAAHSSAAAQQCAQVQPLFFGSGADGAVTEWFAHDDGSGPALYACGDFESVRDVGAGHIARWDGMRWSEVGGGADGRVRTMAEFGGDLFVGGDFGSIAGVTATRVARWNGAQWSGLGAGVNAAAQDLLVHDDGGGPALYVAGAFSSAGGAVANRIARWNGVGWSSLGAGLPFDPAAIASFNGELFAAGAGAARSWNGATWTDRSSGLGFAVRSLAVYSPPVGVTQLFACGAGDVAFFTGSGWSSISPQIPGPTSQWYELNVIDDGGGAKLYMSGRFDDWLNPVITNVYRWNGSSWNAFVSGFSDAVRSIEYFDGGSGGRFYYGGDFDYLAWSGPFSHMASQAPGGPLQPVGPAPRGVDPRPTTGVVQAIARAPFGASDQLVVGGSFSHVGETPATNVALWNGAQWSTLGSLGQVGDTDQVVALESYKPAGAASASLFAAGAFASKIAQWTGTSWLGIAQSPSVWIAWVGALRAFDDGTSFGPALYACGYLGAGPNLEGVIRWNGSAWSTVGAGLGWPVFALTEFDDPTLPGGVELYAGGGFLNGTPHLERWDGVSWNTLAVALPGALQGGTIHHMTSHASGGAQRLYISGYSIPGVWSWDGASWQSIGGPSNQPLASFDAGAGAQLHAGDQVWNGLQWSTLAGGAVGGPAGAAVSALRVIDEPSGASALWICGRFGRIGGAANAGLARYSDPCAKLQSYCTPKVNSLGCTPTIGWNGAPSLASLSTTPFEITASQVLNQRPGLLYYGALGRAAAPFQGGVQCVQAPVHRTPVRSAGGNLGVNDCSGIYSIDFTSWVDGSLDPALQLGVTVDAQWWSRDPASPSTTGLTDAIEFEIRP